MTSTRARSDPGQPTQPHASLPARAIVGLVAVYSAALALLATLLLDDSDSGSGDSNSGDSSSDSGASDLADSSADSGSDSSGGTGHAEQTAARAARRHARGHAGAPDAADVPPPTGGLEG